VSAWTAADAERYLLGLELFGMRFGLDRMRRLMTALGHPERAFDSIHVVGTNGKSSTVRMIAAILGRHGLRTGAYLSPHLVDFAERIRIGDADLDPAAFGAAVQRAASAAAKVDRTLAPDDRVTQFEALTAAAYAELAARGVDVAVVEAGLGGRYDATSVIESRVQVLTNVGLEHQRWLGPTLRDIAREKLAVVRPGATLVCGDLAPEVEEEARAAAEAAGARLVFAPADPGVAVAAPGAFQRRNFALARAAAEAYLGALDAAAVREAAAAVAVPGRMQVVSEEPLTIVDGAHNASGMAALVDALPEVAGGRPVTAVVAVLDDKDAAAMLGALLPACAGVVFTRARNPRSLSPATLESLAHQLGFAATATAASPAAALRRARELAGPEGAVLATGSIYLVADLLAPADRRRASTL
jgi:dihydrofolate synthase / folylpolyglutamate synthase